MTKKRIGLLVMAYGTPESLDDVEAYYTHIRHGRTPSEEALEDLIGRYKAIGGISPLAKITKEQAHKLTDSMNNIFTEYEFTCYLGLKHIAPFIEDAVEEMKRDGIEQAISIVLAPHYSTFSIKAYNDRAIRLSQEIGGPVIEPVEQWYDEPKFISYWADQIKDTFTEIDNKEKAVVIFQRIVCQKNYCNRRPICRTTKAYGRFNCRSCKYSKLYNRLAKCWEYSRSVDWSRCARFNERFI